MLPVPKSRLIGISLWHSFGSRGGEFFVFASINSWMRKQMRIYGGGNGAVAIFQPSERKIEIENASKMIWRTRILWTPKYREILSNYEGVSKIVNEFWKVLWSLKELWWNLAKSKRVLVRLEELSLKKTLISLCNLKRKIRRILTSVHLSRNTEKPLESWSSLLNSLNQVSWICLAQSVCFKQ